MKQEQKLEEERELSAANVMIPHVLWEHFFTTPDQRRPLPENAQAYIEELEKYAFLKDRNYDEFKSFLAINRNLFGQRYTALEKMTEEDIEYVLTRVREERLKKIKTKPL